MQRPTPVRGLVYSDTAKGPWNLRDRRRLVLGNVLGFAVIAVAWWAASGTGDDGEQLAWLEVSILGVLLAGTSNAWYLLRGHRAVQLATGTVFSTGETAQSGEDSLAVRLVAVADTARFHRSTCLLTQGKSLLDGSAAEHQQLGRIACEVCQP
jgi:hypothetical protein